MKTNKHNLLLMFCITGILLVVIPLLLKTSIALPDSLAGFITGLGIGLELLAVILIKKRKYQ